MTVASPGPAVKEAARQVAVDPTTVLKANREVEHEGLVVARPGVGTFVTWTSADATLAAHGPRSCLGACWACGRT
ncbi:GntR family transcriptional regulator [Streptomyces sp. NPDC057199]|uniref:GntR family transcriptional regulator n=1 Tax=Streptomyces sp. NPDC057199 TaxID=3346047 RepID=UPI0036339CC8